MGDPRSNGSGKDGDEGGGDSCFCVEFSGAMVCAAAWDRKKRDAVGLPVGSEGCQSGCASRLHATGSKLKAWLDKPPKARAAEVHNSGATIGGSGGNISSPGLALGARGGSEAREATGGGDWKDHEPESPFDEDDFEEGESKNLHMSELFTPGSRASLDGVTPEEAVALMMARPRQRATQIVAKPVRRVVVVAPASASQAWRLAACEACLKIDARCVRIVSAPAALCLARRSEICPSEGEEKSVLVLDATQLADSTYSIDVAAATVSIAGVSVSSAERRKMTCEKMEKTIAELRAQHKPDVTIVRGLDGISISGVLQAKTMDAVTAAAKLRAFELGLVGSESVFVRETLPVAVSAVQYDLSKKSEDELFQTFAPVPSSIRRTYKRSTTNETLFAFFEGGRATGAGMEDPFETVDDDGEVVYAKSATVEYKVDKRGVVCAQVIEVDAPKSKAREEKEKARSRCRRIAAAVTALFFLTPILYTVVHMRKRTVTRALTIEALEDFYQRAAPDKVGEAASIADKYEGFEELLFKRLENRYPDFKIKRPGESSEEDEAAAADQKEEEDDVQEL